MDSTTWNEIFLIVFGNVTLLQLFGYMWFFLIGYVIYGLGETTGRNIESRDTPREWNWKFWFLDNWRRYLSTILYTYILFRFNAEISGTMQDFSYFDAVTLGLVGDGISATIKRRVDSTTEDRKQLMMKLKKENDI